MREIYATKRNQVWQFQRHKTKFYCLLVIQYKIAILKMTCLILSTICIQYALLYFSDIIKWNINKKKTGLDGQQHEFFNGKFQ